MWRSSYFTLPHVLVFRNARGRFKCRNRLSRQPRRSSHSTKPGFEGSEGENGDADFTKLWRPLYFTVGFSAASFAGASVWEYENLRSESGRLNKHLEKRSRWRRRLNAWWAGKDEGKRIFYALLFPNLLVWSAWRFRRWHYGLLRYFCSNVDAHAPCWPMVLSTFSHISTLHLFVNMYLLHRFSSDVGASLGQEQFLGLYLSAGVIASLCSYLYRAARARPALAVGASGAVMGILGYGCTQHPDGNRISSMFFGKSATMSDRTALRVMMALDVVGLLMRRKGVDHAAHLGGALFGIMWSHWGSSAFWQRREVVQSAWAKLRGHK